jgi:Zn-dependent protease with chaperone function
MSKESVTMAMDFFDHQDVARKKTKHLVIYFVLAVFAIILAVYMTFAFIFLGGQPGGMLNIELFLFVTVSTVILVSCGSLYKIAMLRGGGEAIARMLGGRQLNTNTTTPLERKVLNIVEEMAIASGTPVPPVFMMDHEDGINAFAAGYNPSDAVIGVTRGCVEKLTREQLQGVIAHEFSHILNGDMRLNIRLIGVLHGILLIGLLGYFILRISGRAGRSMRRSKGGGAAVLGMLLLGLGLLVVGYVGVFFGRLIKAAVSRQREFLADASAVQFTRNPDGIGGALAVIGGHQTGSLLGAEKAEECSHMFFGSGLSSPFLGMLATHPPLAKRIARISPSFSGTYKAPDEAKLAEELAEIAGISGFMIGGGPPPLPGSSGAAMPPPLPTALALPVAQAIAVQPTEFVKSVGTLDAEHIEHAHMLVQSIPHEVRNAAHEPYGACALIYAMLINDEADARDRQFQQLQRNTDEHVQGEVARLLPMIEALGPQVRLPLIDICLPALREIADSQYREFRHNVQELVEADGVIDLFEFALQRVLFRHLARKFDDVPAPSIRYFSLIGVVDECSALLSALAYVGSDDDAEIKAAFAHGVVALDIKRDFHLLPPEHCGIETIGQVLDELQCIGFKQKRALLNACAATVAADGIITIEEAELIRAVADSLDCPLPPLIARV